ncbi:hypothetical protein DEU56DRAFT_751991 [Suillus clintonianus]|uniref:uncharacterized protein n=1 Tax=Suillus clintonianus TaxID=1904413 RepID=UPI001B85F1BA|nr:uncharacterized protein DEU56DRAFT_751991 [Suillus clintonianus]KAG2153411.1 hypothetical protein DEU56DRAFT_751991 [Suillus clintonianus]
MLLVSDVAAGKLHELDQLLDNARGIDYNWDIYGSNAKLRMNSRCSPSILKTQGVDPLSEHQTGQFLRYVALHPIEICIFPRLRLLSLLIVPHPTRHLHLFLTPTLGRCVPPDVYSDLVTRCAALKDLSTIYCGPAQADQLLRALSQCKACQALEYVNIFTGNPVVQERSCNSFMPIRQPRNLQPASPHCYRNLNSDLLFEAMSTWPHIRSLELMSPLANAADIIFFDAAHIDITAELFSTHLPTSIGSGLQ